MGSLNVEVVGTMKYDNVNLAPAEKQREKYKQLLRLKDDERVLIAGSVHPPEHIIVARTHKKLLNKGLLVRLILVPRHPEKYEMIKKDLINENVRFELRSQFEISEGKPDLITFVDTVGELGILFSVADLAFVGGSLIPHGGQNMIEPAGLGAVPIFGLHTWNFEEPVDELLKADAAIMLKYSAPKEKSKGGISVNNSPGISTDDWIAKSVEELTNICYELFTNNEKFVNMQTTAIKVVEKGKGAAKRTVQKIREFLDSR